MSRYALALLCVAALCGVAAPQDDAKDLEQFHVVYEWFKLDFAWPDDTSKARALTSQRYVPENNAISGIKVYRERVFLSVPRYRDGVPATLVSVATASPDRNASPKLEPFPSWAMQEPGNCSALQSVHSMEVDTQGRLWVLDTGRVNTMGRSDPRCPAKLVLFDLTAGPGYSADSADSAGVHVANSGGRVIRSFQFPASVADALGSYLVDLALDPTDGWFAYISDAGDADPGVIVYSFLEDRAWKVRDERSMRGDPSARKFSVGGRPAELLQHVSPLAVDLRRARLLYSPLSSLALHALPTALLRDPARASEAPHAARSLGSKLGRSQGFAMDERGVLYYGLVDDSGIAKWDSNTSFQDNQHVISKDPVRLQWPTSFGFDEVGNLWLVSNRLHNYMAGRVNLSEANYRVIRGLTGSRSYLYTEGAGRGDEWAGPTTAATPDADNNTSRYSSGGGWAAAAPLALWAAAVAARTLA